MPLIWFLVRTKEIATAPLETQKSCITPMQLFYYTLNKFNRFNRNMIKIYEKI